MWTLTIPKLLRPYFLHHRPLLGNLCRAAWETVRELIAAAAGGDVRPGMVAAIHTAASDLRFHPHVHALASRGGWDQAGTWHPLPYVDTHANEDRIELLDSWKSGHTGFSAHCAVTVGADDPDGVERLARCSPQTELRSGPLRGRALRAPAGPDLLRPPLSLERLTLEPGRALCRHKAARQRRGEPFDPDELLARLLMHIPAPRLHVVRYSGYYAHVCRARRRQVGAEGGQTDDSNASHAGSDDDGPTSAERRRLRRQWAELLRRIYEE